MTSAYTAFVEKLRRAYVLQQKVEAFKTKEQEVRSGDAAAAAADTTSASAEELAHQQSVVAEYLEITSNLNVELETVEREHIHGVMKAHMSGRSGAAAAMGAAPPGSPASFSVQEHMGSMPAVPVDMRYVSPTSSLCTNCNKPAELTVVSSPCCAGASSLCDCASTTDVFAACAACWSEYVAGHMSKNFRKLLCAEKKNDPVPPPIRNCEIPCMQCGQATCAFRMCKIVDQPAPVATATVDHHHQQHTDIYEGHMLPSSPIHPLGLEDQEHSLGFDSIFNNTDFGPSLFPTYNAPVATTTQQQPNTDTMSSILSGVSVLLAELSTQGFASLETANALVYNIQSVTMHEFAPAPAVVHTKPPPSPVKFQPQTNMVASSGVVKRRCKTCGMTGHNARGHDKAMASMQHVAAQT